MRKRRHEIRCRHRSPVRPRPSEVQVWNQIAEQEKRLGDALMHFGRAINWFDIYKALECLCDWSGGSGAELKNSNWGPPSEIEASAASPHGPDSLDIGLTSFMLSIE